MVGGVSTAGLASQFVRVGVSTYVLDESALVLERVTLGKVVELVVEVLVDLSAGTVLDQEAAEDALAAHPEDLAAHVVSTGTSKKT